MTLEELDSYFRSILPIEDFSGIDSSLNGVQVGQPGLEVQKVAFSVDACLETFRRAVQEHSQVLFVHHGIYWGRVEPITGTVWERIRTLMDGGIALYAAHLPLDMHGELGNNAQMAAALGLGALEPFGMYKGRNIGWKGELPAPASLDEVTRTLFGSPDDVLGILPFGRPEVRTVAIVSGGAPHEVDEAIDQGIDLYITGDASHTIYHRCLEASINVIFGGHYRTETWGVRAVARKLAEEKNIETSFIDVPTGF